MTLSRPQIGALRYVNARQLFAADVNAGDGNRRRTILWLIDRDLLGWDPIYRGRLVVTDAGAAQLQNDRDRARKGVR